MSKVASSFRDSLLGCLLGTAVGDAIGLPAEGLSKRRQTALLGPIEGHRFFFGKGTFSDDTEHACMVAHSLLSARGDLQRFKPVLGRSLKRWLLTVPGGVGWATLRAILKLWVGFSPEMSGVFSAGNGPAMRSPILGVFFNDSLDQMREWVRVSTRITHIDPKAEQGALAVALAAQEMAHGDGVRISAEKYLCGLQSLVFDDAKEFLRLMELAVRSGEDGQATPAFAESLGLGQGVSGYVYHTVPVAIQAVFRHKSDFQSAILDGVRCGGDTDTVGAIVGAIIGAGTGPRGIPRDWLSKTCLWPYTFAWMKELCCRLEAMKSGEDNDTRLSFPLAFAVLRNLCFTTLILAHGFRRIAPPY